MVATTCAVCRLDDGLVINLIVASPSDPAQEGCQLIEVTSDMDCEIGWTWNGSIFVPPAPVGASDGN